jgi:hypothetical protein
MHWHQGEAGKHTVSSARANDESFLSSDIRPNELYESSLDKFDLTVLDVSDVSASSASGALMCITDGVATTGVSVIMFGDIRGEAFGGGGRHWKENLPATLRVQLGTSRIEVIGGDRNVCLLASFEFAKMARL